jgi:hypothetical protein
MRQRHPASPSTITGVISLLLSKRPYVFATWAVTLLFGTMYALEDQIILFGPRVANRAGVSIPAQILIFGPEPMQAPPQFAYYMTLLGNSGFIQINLSGLAITALLSVLFGINVSLMIFLKRMVTGGFRRSGSSFKSFFALLGALPSLASTAGCCCCAPFFLLLLGDVAADSVGFILMPYFAVFVYASVAIQTFNIYYFGKKACGRAGSSYHPVCNVVTPSLQGR